ncbi:MAG: pyruvate:ferredoxin (flavodoxin) oxidoreductase [Verrucomicrobiae bacterium]|nr:pyruvate:ferredoxin (flavodoxin) oxidoreductase [Verrucomicrobiae bacterium]
MNRKHITIDGNEAVAYVAYRCNEVAAIYPITPSSNMGEWCDQWASEGIPNLWGTIPSVTEMQSEAGAAGAVHGSLQTGALTCTFTASQGLLLKIPNMFKIAGELTPTVFHITARCVATHALSIFGDHSDVMAARSTGFALFSSASVQEAMDFALIAQAATLESRVPFLHFFDGFRTSHEASKIELVDEEIIRQMIDENHVIAHRARAMSPDRPVLRGTAQNPDVFFQARESCNPFYLKCPEITQKAMDKFAGITGRQYKIYQYEGAPDADRVIVLMGSGCEAAHETVDFLRTKGEKVGVLKVRLYRPFDVKRFMEALPSSVKSLSALDRTKEPGSAGEPLYLDVVAALNEGLANGWGSLKSMPKVLAGRYGLSSKEFTPAMIKAVFDNMSGSKPKNHFTVGINEDVTHSSLTYDPSFSTEPASVVRALFFGLGSDGTVGANKNSIKIIGENTDNYAQGYFVYDSKKAGAVTVSHLRFGPKLIRSTYLISQANFVACHQPVFLERYNMLEQMVAGGTFLLNTPNSKEEAWDKLPRVFQEELIRKKAKFYVIDAVKVAKETGMGGRINTIMQTCFFALAGVLPRDEAIEQIKKAIKKTYGKKGEDVVKKNIAAVDQTLVNLHEIKVPAKATSTIEMPPVFAGASDHIRKWLGSIYGNLGESVPSSAFTPDGTFPTATTQWEKRNLALEIPVWDEKTCIQCGKCAAICPHACIRPKVYDPKELAKAPAKFKSTDARSPEWKGLKYTLQVAAEDCTSCYLCINVCPAKNKTETKLKAINMREHAPLRQQERENWKFFLSLPEFDRRKIKVTQLRQQQLMRPLFEFSGACAGCGETPYLKLLSQLFGDRLVVGNATGCSSIYGGNLPTTPWAVDANGRGPTWNNSLFEDAAEFTLGYRLSIDKQAQFARELLKKMGAQIGDDLVKGLVEAGQADETGIHAQRERVAALKTKLAKIDSKEAKMLLSLADILVRKSVWGIGGDGWAYDIGYGGLDHVLASGRDINLVVLDTEVYSNTGGQMSKSTPRGAVAKFAAGGKPLGKKDLGLIAMSYGSVYVAGVALGAKDEHTLRAFVEAESYAGPSLIICYSHCIAHGIALDRGAGVQQQKMAVESGQWLLYRYDPRRAAAGENPFQLDSQAPKMKVQDYLYSENRFKMLVKSKPEDAKRLAIEAQKDVDTRWALYEYMAARKGSRSAEAPANA